MCERPISLLVDALRSLGADIRYLKNEGFPPIHVKGLHYSGVNTLAIRGDVSSQYISALLMIAPALPDGLKLTLTGHVGSKPYIQMTLKQMEHFGIQSHWQEDTITIPKQEYKPAAFWVESDWSAASYWYSISALAEEANIELRGLKSHSLQGDSTIASIMEQMGVQSTFVEGGVQLTKSVFSQKVAVDFTHCPDLAQTIAVICAARNIHLTLTGIESLKIKETDRIKALQQELFKFGAILQETSKEVYEVTRIPAWQPPLEPVVVETYDDHRMAMAFAPMALIQDTRILHPQVVVKSYPRYWQDLKQAGFGMVEE
jgi:3-phosphoshikimate 1-carboxyvinyltransferase